MNRRRGSALLLVLGILGILAILTSGLMEMMKGDSDFEVAKNKSFQARLLAESGIAIASNPNVDQYDEVLYQKLDNGDVIYAEIMGEQGRLNINTLLTNSTYTHYLQELFNLWEVPVDQASDLIARLQDWVDADEIPQAGGAEAQDYISMGLPYVPGNRPFRNVDEMDRVYGIQVLYDYKPDWKSYFTVFGGPQLDVNSAPAELIQVVCGIDEMLAQSVVDMRYNQGPDGSYFRFTNLDQFRGMIGMNATQFNRIRSRLTLRSTYRRITSTGYVGDFSQVLTAILRWNQSKPVYVEWQNGIGATTSPATNSDNAGLQEEQNPM